MPEAVLDIEWDANDPDKPLLCIGFAGTVYDRLNNSLREMLADDRIDKVVFTKADHDWLLKHGIGVGGDVIDVQTMAWCYDERTPLTLDWCVREYLGFDPDKRVLRRNNVVLFRCDDGSEVPIGEAPLDQLMEYNARDIKVTEQLYQELVRRLKSIGSYEYWERMHKPFTRVLIDMEQNGIPLDVEATRKLERETKQAKANLEVRLKVGGGLPDEFNLNSTAQMAYYLFQPEFDLSARVRLSKEDMAAAKEGEWPDALPLTFEVEKLGRDYATGRYHLEGRGLKPKVKAPKCKARECDHPRDGSQCLPSVAAKVLKVHHADDPWVESFCEFKQLEKVDQFLSVWLKEQRNGRLYTHFNQTGTATGRLSSSDPVNLQNVPSRGHYGSLIRGLFVAPPGYMFVDGDFNQIEPRLMAHFSGDPKMLEAFWDKVDIYEQATVGVLGKRYPKGTPERQLVRTCFLALAYGAQPPKIRNNLAEEGFRFPLKKVEEAYDGIINLYSVFWEWKDAAISEGRSLGYVTTIAGHRRHIDFSESWKAERQAVNSKIQGSAADICQDTLVEVARQLPHWKACAAVHDEGLYLVREEGFPHSELMQFRHIAEGMSEKYKLRVPIVFEPKMVRSWKEAK